MISPCNRRVDGRTPFWLCDIDGKFLLQDGLPVLFVPHHAEDPFLRGGWVQEDAILNLSVSEGRALFREPEAHAHTNALQCEHRFKVKIQTGETVAWLFYGKPKILV